jgi:hypothetical protein
MSDFQRKIGEFVAKQAEIQQKEVHEKRVETLIRIQSAAFEKAQAYVRVVIAAGYAGFFIAWSGTRNHLSALESIWSALLIVVSLFFYVLFEIYQMTAFVRTLNGLDRVANAPIDEFEQLAQQHQRSVEQGNRRIMRVWFVALFLTIAPGIAGALILMSAFARFLLGY